MAYSAIENTSITVDLINQAKTTGWSIDGVIASHSACNSGFIVLKTYELKVGHTYNISFGIPSITSGIVQLYAGNSAGVARNSVGSYVETITPTGINPLIKFYSDGNCQVQAFNIQEIVVNHSAEQQDTIVYSPVINKWTSFYTFSPDIGFSMFTRSFVFNQGIMYSQANGSLSRNNLFGVQYDSLFKVLENKTTGVIKTYQSLAIQGNQLIVTTDNGIETSLGQLSALIDDDFEQQLLTDGSLTVNVYDRYGVYMASFFNDEYNDELKGNYIIIQLKSTDSANPMQIFSVDIKSAVQHIGNR